ncbi:Vesicle-fusing ATPase [Camellia lanceoleosa]|uniref:Vesicle-fusing ATPase n=1 Tax=Camellia lanceoleosa TaxID=1840588 RepID=A0ACC0HL43_9ERIC|nr:Vesicle-fusing ATPase [Camellia lanceoleosa]
MGGICSPFQLSDLSFNSVPRPPSARCAQANRRWPCLQKLRGTLIRGAETCKSSAFGSRMVPPYVAKRLNLKHVRGMLLYGPPGSGKTLIARSICKFLNAKEPLIINGPDVLDAFQGVSERKIRSLFKAAVEDEKNFGAESDLHIIIFDEIDSIAKVSIDATFAPSKCC